VPITDKKLTNMEIYRQYVPGAEPVRWRGSRLSCGLRKLFAVALLALLPGVAAAQASASPPDLAIVSIDDLVSTTLIHNPALKAAERGVDAATAAVVSAGALPNPRLELNGGRNAISSSGSITGIGVSQLIENPALRQARVSGALYAQQGSQQSVAATRNELVAQVRLRAYEYLLRRLQAQEAAESLQLLEQIRERIKVRVDTGETGKLDLIRSDAEIVNASQRERTARLQIVQAATTLNRLAAGMLPPRWELDAELDDTVVLPPLEQLKQEATRLNPEVRLLEAELSRTRSRIDEANASLLPGVELRLSQSREPELRQEMIGVSVQLPLFDWKRGPKAEAIAERERTLVRLEGRRAELLQQLELAWRAVEIANVRVTALSDGVSRSAEAALRVAEAAYRYGERGILEVLDAQRVLRSVRQDLLLARFDLKAAQIELEALSGRYASKQ